MCHIVLCRTPGRNGQREHHDRDDRRPDEPELAPFGAIKHGAGEHQREDRQPAPVVRVARVEKEQRQPGRGSQAPATARGARRPLSRDREADEQQYVGRNRHPAVADGVAQARYRQDAAEHDGPDGRGQRVDPRCAGAPGR